jgi:hypothetical protein
MGGLKSCYGCFGQEKKNLLPLLGFEPGTSSLQPSNYIDYSISAPTGIKIYSENKQNYNGS